jgi:CRISPR system Cascade subunit CasE
MKLFLSRLCLNPLFAPALRLAGDTYEMHRTLWSTGFRHFTKDDLGRVLFRVDADRESAAPIVLVQSEREPDWSTLPPRFVIATPETKPLDVKFSSGQRLRFRLRANPTKKVGAASKSERLAGARNNGKRIALLRDADQIEWLLDKGVHGGFTISGQWREVNGVKTPIFSVDAVPEGWLRCGKDGHAVGQHFAVRFDGVLSVIDPTVFRNTLQHGIGSAKGFGFGLLSVARREGSPMN